MKKDEYLAWFNWKNPDEMKSRPLAETIVELNLSVMMTYDQFAELMGELGRKEFIIKFKKTKTL